MKTVNERIENNFKYHSLKPGQPERCDQIRDTAKELAYLISTLCHDGRERQLAMTKLEETVMWANSAIAREE